MNHVKIYMMNSKKVFHSPEICVVEASAGSGKTYALAKRYVRLILSLSFDQIKKKNIDQLLNKNPVDVIPIHTILAITFTNKASFEMKERILKFLKQLALKVMPQQETEEILQDLGMNLDEASQIAHYVIHAILRKYNYFQVQTIDKFINTLLIGSAFQIGLTANFKIKTTAKNYLMTSLDRLIDIAQQDKNIEKLFENFLFSMLIVESRSSWMPKKIILDTLIELFKEYNTHACSFVPPAMILKDIVEQKKEVIDDVKTFVSSMPDQVHVKFETALRSFVEENEYTFSFSGISDYFHPLKDIPVKKGFSVSSWHQDQWKKIQQGFKNAAQLEIRYLYDAYVFIFEQVFEFLKEMEKKDDVLFLEELNAKAKQIYEQGLSPEELYYRIATRFEHYLFDEFQDTSVLQWQNLKVLPEDAIARGGSLFYVGDKKQAIYSFRGGDTKLFDQLREQYQQEGYHLKNNVLNVSRRSCRSIVDVNNQIFHIDHLMSFMTMEIEKADHQKSRLIPAREEDFLELKRLYQTSHQEVYIKDPQGYVEIRRIEAQKKEDSDQQIKKELLECIEALRKRFYLKDIGILVRKNKEIEKVTQWLLEAGVPCSSERTLNIKEHPIIKEICSFLRFLISPIDNMSLGEFLLGDLFAQTTGILKEDIQFFILTWRKEKKEYLYVAFRKHYPEVWQKYIEEYFKNVGVFSVYEMVVSFYQCTQVLNVLPHDVGFLMKFLNFIKKHEEEFSNLESFLCFYDDWQADDLFVDVVASDVVHIMTTHKAKGLEFPVVIAPFLTMSLNKVSSAKNMALKYSLRHTQEGLVCYHFNQKHIPYSSLAETLDLDDKMQMFFSELNNIYVTLTRASYELYVFIPFKAGHSDNLAKYLIPEHLVCVGEKTLPFQYKNYVPQVIADYLSPSSCRDWMSFLKDEFVSHKGDVSGDIHRGVLYHEILSKMIDMKEGVDAAFEQAVCSLRNKVQQADIVFLKKALACAAIRDLFLQQGEVFTEYEITDRWGCLFRLDRVVMSAHDVLVIDFKLSKNKEASHREQVNQYMQLLKALYPQKNIKGCLVFLTEIEIVYV